MNGIEEGKIKRVSKVIFFFFRSLPYLDAWKIYRRHREPIRSSGIYSTSCSCTFTTRWFAPSMDQASSSARDRYNDIEIGATNECTEPRQFVASDGMHFPSFIAFDLFLAIATKIPSMKARGKRSDELEMIFFLFV